MRTPTYVLVALTVAFGCRSAAAVTLPVGPGQTYTVPSAAAAVAQDGDVIEIAAGEYLGDVTNWTANNLTIRGVGGYAHLRADGQDYGGKGIWVIQGNNTTVEWIEFSEASVVDENGAGIRQEGTGLTVRNCYFHDNENGILAGDDSNSDILIEYTHFARNGFGDGFTHNLYINHVRTLTFRYNYSHHAVIGHNLKSRAHVNYVLYNRLMDEADGTSSRLIDLPNGGDAYVIGNLIQQAPTTDNSNLFCFACEGASNPSQSLYVINNTFVNDRSAGSFVSNQSSFDAVIRNNIFLGNGTVLNGPGTQISNLVVSADPGFIALGTYDYRLTASATAAIDQGTAPGSAGGFDLTPASHYVHTADAVRRPVVGALDIGAYEYGTASGNDGGSDPDGGPNGDPVPPGDPGSAGDPVGPGDPGSAGDPTVSGDPTSRGDAQNGGDPSAGTPVAEPATLSGGCSCGATLSPAWLFALLLLRRRRR